MLEERPENWPLYAGILVLLAGAAYAELFGSGYTHLSWPIVAAFVALIAALAVEQWLSDRAE